MTGAPPASAAGSTGTARPQASHRERTGAGRRDQSHRASLREGSRFGRAPLGWRHVYSMRTELCRMDNMCRPLARTSQGSG